MAAYSIGAYTNDPDQLSKNLRIDRNDIVYFNTTATVGKPACFLAINHKSKEYVLFRVFNVESLPVFVAPLQISKYSVTSSFSHLLFKEEWFIQECVIKQTK